MNGAATRRFSWEQQTVAEQPDQKQHTTARRVFVHIAGYYPLAPQDNYRRFLREYTRSLKAWGWSGHFVQLDKGYQDQIIERTSYSV